MISIILQTIDVGLTGYSSLDNFFSLLYIALTLALFQSLGKVLVSRDFLNITDRGVAMATANSLRYMGWIWSGPGDLSIFSLLISLVTSVSV